MKLLGVVGRQTYYRLSSPSPELEERFGISVIGRRRGGEEVNAHAESLMRCLRCLLRPVKVFFEYRRGHRLRRSPGRGFLVVCEAIMMLTDLDK